MLKNYFQIALRHIKKNKGYAFINMIGLSLGIACAILILLWVNDEVQYNKFQKSYNSLYQVIENQTYEGKTYTFSALPGKFAAAIKDELPEIKYATRTDWGTKTLFSVGDKNIYETGYFADPDFLKMFSFELIKGDTSKLLTDPTSIVITTKMAEKFFGEEDPVGKTIRVNNEKEFTITGLLKEPPLNSTLKFSWLAAFQVYEDQNQWLKEWGNNGIQTFVQLKTGVDPKQLDKKLHDFISKKDTSAIAKPFLLAMNDWRLRSRFEDGKYAGGRIENVKMFSIIGLLIIIIACINFMNLATARSEQRAREVGVRKVLGAGRGILIKQFFGESIMMSFVAMLVAALIVFLVLPSFNTLVEKKLSFDLSNPVLWAGLPLLGLICGAIAGSYPSLYLSSFNPSTVFKGLRIGKNSATVNVRKGLVITQFAISIVLIISTIIIYRQIEHVMDRQLGYNKENIIYISLKGKMNEHFPAIHHDLLSTGVVENAALSNSRVLNVGSSSGDFSWQGKAPGSQLLVSLEWVSPEYISTMGMKLATGRDFYPDITKDSSSIIINETFANIIGKKDLVGDIIRRDNGNGKELRIVGVVKDFVFNDMYKKPDPLILFCDTSNVSTMLVRLKSKQDIQQQLAKIENVVKANNPGYPFESKFLDEDFNSLFKSEMLIGKLSRLFALLTILISCLGLLGLAAYTAERRTKEIGIRKVLGATVTNVITLLAVGVLILLWVQDELSFDKFHHNSGEIYRVNGTVGTSTSRQTGEYTPGPIAAISLTQIPGVKNAVRISGNYDYSVFRYKDKTFTENEIAYTDPSLFSVFDFRFIEGSSKQPFTDNNSIIITASTAKRYFGSEDPIGKVIVADNKRNFVVNGMMEDFPENSSIKYDILFPISLFEKKYDSSGYWKSLDTDWGNYYFNTFLQLQPGINIQDVESKLAEAHKKIQPEAGNFYSLQPLTKIHLYQPDGNDAGMKAVDIFLVIAILILVIGCINYVNLSTARAMLRSKEVSIRKIIGAGKAQLFIQFVIETALIFVFVTILALGLIYLLMPVYNNISGKNIQFSFFSVNVWKITAATIVFTLAASSIYPALLLSSFEPLKALKGKISLGIANVSFRKVLVVAQFVFSVALIIGTIIISGQMKYIQTKELGYDKENVLSFPMKDMKEHYAAVKNELMKKPAIKGVTSSQGNIVHVQGMTGDTEWDSKEPQRLFLIHPVSIDEGFIPFFKINMAEGANFMGAVSDSDHFILNETAIREAGIKDPVGKRFKLHETDGTIIGVVKDFHLTSLKQKIEPAIFYYKAANPRMYIKTTGKDAQQAIATTEQLWKQFNPAYPFEYSFLDETYNELYKTEQRTGLLFNVFAVVAILISCLGLLGLATYTAQVKTKEIGIRKVLGASVVGIVQLLAKDFILLVTIAIVIAVPIAWWAMNSWLQDFTYRINIEWWVFAAAGVIAVFIAMMTVSFQAVRSAMANPVKNLRTE